MANVLRQSIPPSLIAAYKTVLNTPYKATSNAVRLGLNTKATQAQPVKPANKLLKVQTEAAHWLTDQWQPAHAAAFYAERLQELKTQLINPDYWYTVSPSADRTEWGTPELLAYERPVNGQYADPLRIQSNCVYTQWSKTYPTPLDAGTDTEPAPGWEGLVTDQIWQDLWFAQRRLSYALPVSVSKTDSRPVLIDLNSTVDAIATFRANTSWFARGVYAEFSHSHTPPTPIENYLITKWRKQDIYPMDLLNTDPHYFTCTNTLRVLLSARASRSFDHLPSANLLSLIVTTPPARGVYFARNDHVKVTHHESLNLILGKTPHG